MSSGTAGFGNVEFVKHDKSVKAVGRIKAGGSSFDGRIATHNDVSSPPRGKHGTMLSGDSIQMGGNAINGAVIRGRDVFVADVVGLRRVVGDAARAGVFHDRSLSTRIVMAIKFAITPAAHMVRVVEASRIRQST